LQGKRALVTGINREIGAAIAQTLAHAGCHVVGAYYGEYDRVAPLLHIPYANHGQLVAIDADLTKVSEHQRLVAETVSHLGGIDIYVANAGVTVFGPVTEMTESQWDSVFDLNVKGTYFGTQAVAHQMLTQARGGRIIFSSSVTGIAAMAGGSVYGTSKAALRHMAANLGVELGSHGITVNAIAIGATLNDRNVADDPAYASTWQHLSPVGRVGYPADVANTVLYLCSPLADLVNGQTLVIDGGWTHTVPIRQAGIEPR
jgi:NAD(P)-dependent dehydrogenase (short-subunit alcohol dehydrogenase family)